MIIIAVLTILTGIGLSLYAALVGQSAAGNEFWLRMTLYVLLIEQFLSMCSGSWTAQFRRMEAVKPLVCGVGFVVLNAFEQALAINFYNIPMLCSANYALAIGWIIFTLNWLYQLTQLNQMDKYHEGVVAERAARGVDEYGRKQE